MAPRRAVLVLVFTLGTSFLAEAATFVVTTTDPAGPGSLGQAIDDANATPNVGGVPDRIEFNIVGFGPYTIQPYDYDLAPLTEAAPGPDPVQSVLSFLAHPNPASFRTLLSFTLARRSAVSLKVFDSRGRLARTIVDGELGASDHVFMWDSRNDAGRPLPNGVYFMQLIADGAARSKKVTLVR